MRIVGPVDLFILLRLVLMLRVCKIIEGNIKYTLKHHRMQEQLCINIPGFPLSILPPLLLEILYYLVFISTSSHRPLKLNGLWRFGSKCDGEQCYTRAKCPTACCIESIEIIIVTGRYWLLLLRLLAFGHRDQHCTAWPKNLR